MHAIPELEKIRVGTLHDLLLWHYQQAGQLALSSDTNTLYKSSGPGPGSEVLEVYNLSNFSSDVEDADGDVIVSEVQALRFGADFTVTDLSDGRARIDFDHAATHAWTAAHSWTGAAVGTVMQRTFVGAELVARHHVTADGTHYWGNGTDAPDWSMVRDSASVFSLKYNSASLVEAFRNSTYGSLGVSGPVDGACEVTVYAGAGNNYAGLHVSDLNDVTILFAGSPELQFSMETTDIIPWAIIDTGHLRPNDASSAYDIGDVTHRVRDVHVGRNAVFNEWTLSRFSSSVTYLYTTGNAQGYLTVGGAGAEDYIAIGHNGTDAVISTDWTGQAINLSCDTAINLYSVTWANGWSVLGTGHFRPTQPGVYDIGDDTHRVRDVYVADSIIAAGGISSVSYFMGDSTAIRNSAGAGSISYMDLGTAIFRNGNGANSNAVVQVHGWVRTYGPSAIGYTSITHDETNGVISTSVGGIVLTADGDAVSVVNADFAQVLRVFGALSTSRYVELNHDGINGSTLKNSQGSMVIGATNGEFYVQHVGVANLYLFTTSSISPLTPNTRDLGDATNTFRTGYFGTNLLVGAVPATTGLIRCANNNGIHFRNAANDGNIAVLEVDAGNNIILGNTVTSLVVVGNSTAAVRIVNGAGLLGFFGTDSVSGRSGWTPPTGTALRTGFATGSATLENVAQTLKALIDDLHQTSGYGLLRTYMSRNFNDVPGDEVIPDTFSSGLLSADADLAYDRLDLQYFSAHSLLPSTMYKLAYATFPAADYSNLGGGSNTFSRGLLTNLSAGALATFGWDTGGLRSKILFVVGGWRPKGAAGSTYMVMYDGASAPGAADAGGNGYLAGPQIAGNIHLIQRRSSVPAYTSLVTEAQLGITNDVITKASGFAFYYDDSTGSLILFVRHGSEGWWPVLETTDSTYTTMRYVGLRINASNLDKNFIACPMAIYYTP